LLATTSNRVKKTRAAAAALCYPGRKKMKRILQLSFTCALFSSFAFSSEIPSCIAGTLDDSKESFSAQVGNHHIGTEEFVATLQIEAKNRFYHAAAPEADTEVFKKEVIDRLIDDRLLSDYAIFERGLSISKQKIALRNMQLDDELANTELTSDQIDNIKNYFLCQFERTEMVEALRDLIDNETSISDQDVLEFYNRYPEKFTSPVRNRLGLILIGVDPSAGSDVWAKAKERIDAIYFQLQEGSDFSLLATEHSSDISARHGGDMGYQHTGMLGDAIETEAQNMTPGNFTNPINLLEGWAIVKLIERHQAELNPLKKVYDRAYALTLREAKENNWEDLIERLRNKNSISYFLN